MSKYFVGSSDVMYLINITNTYKFQLSEEHVWLYLFYSLENDIILIGYPTFYISPDQYF